MNSPDARLAGARALLAELLSGRITPESEPALFEEDDVLISVAIVERAEPAWLLAQLADRRYPLAGRLEVFHHLRATRQQAHAILLREDPNLPLWNWPGA